MIVNTNRTMDYSVMERNLTALLAKYPFLVSNVIGKSVQKRSIYVVRLGTGSRAVSYNGTHHSMEWITSLLLMKFIEDYCEAYVKGTRLGGFDVRTIFRNVSIYIVPMVNPDGVQLFLYGGEKYRQWQANARGVDLNHNYNAGWEEGKILEAEMGITGPGPTRYGGPYPESEPEVQAMVNLTLNINFLYVIAFHSQGQVIYWRFLDKEPPQSRQIGELLSEASGYALDETEGIASFGGYKDWVIDRFNKPGYTVEVGIGKNPLPLSQFDKIYNDTLEMMLLAGV